MTFELGPSLPLTIGHLYTPLRNSAVNPSLIASECLNEPLNKECQLRFFRLHWLVPAAVTESRVLNKNRNIAVRLTECTSHWTNFCQYNWVARFEIRTRLYDWLIARATEQSLSVCINVCNIPIREKKLHILIVTLSCFIVLFLLLYISIGRNDTGATWFHARRPWSVRRCSCWKRNETGLWIL